MVIFINKFSKYIMYINMLFNKKPQKNNKIEKFRKIILNLIVYNSVIICLLFKYISSQSLNTTLIYLFELYICTFVLAYFIVYSLTISSLHIHFALFCNLLILMLLYFYSSLYILFIHISINFLNNYSLLYTFNNFINIVIKGNLYGSCQKTSVTSICTLFNCILLFRYSSLYTIIIYFYTNLFIHSANIYRLLYIFDNLISIFRESSCKKIFVLNICYLFISVYLFHCLFLYKLFIYCFINLIIVCISSLRTRLLNSRERFRTKHYFLNYFLFHILVRLTSPSTRCKSIFIHFKCVNAANVKTLISNNKFINNGII